MAAAVIETTMMVLLRPWIGSCNEAMARLSDHLEGELAPAEDRRVHRHLSRCRRCRSVFESLRRVVDQVRAVGDGELHEPSSSVAEQVTARIRHDSS